MNGEGSPFNGALPVRSNKNKNTKINRNETIYIFTWTGRLLITARHVTRVGVQKTSVFTQRGKAKLPPQGTDPPPFKRREGR